MLEERKLKNQKKQRYSYNCIFRIKSVFAIMLSLLIFVLSVSPLSVLASPAKTDWTIAVYLCGTDLESNYGSATYDILEMLDEKISPNVRLLIFTGGTEEWNPYGVPQELVEQGELSADAYITPSNESNQLFEIKNGKMTLLKDYGSYLNMGQVSTAKTFVEDVINLAPSDKLMLSFWDHGGGPFGGVAYDQTNNDPITLSEFKEIFSYACDLRDGDKIDIVGFDACISSNIETAISLSEYCEYMIASEESEPAEGWDYRFLSIFDEEYNDGDSITSPSSVELGKRIVDDYAYSLNNEGNWSAVNTQTLALIDLSRANDLKTAFSSMASELKALTADDEKYVQLMRINETLSQISNDTGLVDLYEFASNVLSLVPSAQGVIDVLGTPPEQNVGEIQGTNSMALYRGSGQEYIDGVGIAFFCPTLESYDGTQGPEYIEKYVNRYREFGISDDYADYLQITMCNLDENRVFDGEASVTYNEQSSHYELHIPDVDALNAVRDVSYVNIYTDATPGKPVSHYYLGTVPSVSNWNEGTFTEDFDGYWYTINGEPITATVESYYYGLLQIVIPIKIDGIDEICSLYAYQASPDENYPDGFTFIDSVYIPASNNSEDGPEGRYYSPEGDFTFYPVLYEYDYETNQTGEYHVQDTAVTVKYNEAEGCYLLNDVMSKMPLNSGNYSLYSGYFKITDMKYNVTLSDPCYYAIIDKFDRDLTIEAIPEQVYTGFELKPTVKLLFNGNEVFTEGVDYKVEYTNNINVGTATVTVTSLMDDLPGVLTTTFEIKMSGADSPQDKNPETDIKSETDTLPETDTNSALLKSPETGAPNINHIVFIMALYVVATVSLIVIKRKRINRNL